MPLRENTSSQRYVYSYSLSADTILVMDTEYNRRIQGGGGGAPFLAKL